MRANSLNTCFAEADRAIVRKCLVASAVEDKFLAIRNFGNPSNISNANLIGTPFEPALIDCEGEEAIASKGLKFSALKC